MSGFDVIQIGANRGKSASDLVWIFVEEKGWKGLFVEPLLNTFHDLKQYYGENNGHAFEQAAIVASRELEEVTLHYGFQDEWASTKQGHMGNSNSSAIKVPALTLNALIAKHHMTNIPFEFLQFDVEGVEKEIIIATDFSTILAKFICVEVIHMSPHSIWVIDKHLSNFGYEPIVDEIYWPAHKRRMEEVGEKPEPRHFNKLYTKKEQ